MQPFHLAFPVNNLKETRDFYEGLLGCSVGRTSDRWIDFNFWGNQITAHLVDEPDPGNVSNAVDGKSV
ncbi:MAG: VOC family protein, partial [Bacteroidota bacterium]